MKGPCSTMENSCFEEPGSLANQEKPTTRYNNSYNTNSHNGTDIDVNQITDQVKRFSGVNQNFIDLFYIRVSNLA